MVILLLIGVITLLKASRGLTLWGDVMTIQEKRPRSRATIVAKSGLAATVGFQVDCFALNKK